MIGLKRVIAASIVCFKPHVLLTLCILLVIAQSIVVAIQKSASTSNIASWRQQNYHNVDIDDNKQQQSDLTLTMTTMILAIALIWASFFVSLIRYELRNELEALLILFQSSKRGLRFLGVVFFHIGFLIIVAFMVSAAVERSANNNEISTINNHLYPISNRLSTTTLISSSDNLQYFEKSNTTTSQDRLYLMRIYKIWLTAIVYAFLYLLVENIIMFHADISLIEFIHEAFLDSIAKLTGIDLSDYPAGEMLFNPLVRRILNR